MNDKISFYYFYELFLILDYKFSNKTLKVIKFSNNVFNSKVNKLLTNHCLFNIFSFIIFYLFLI